MQKKHKIFLIILLLISILIIRNKIISYNYESHINPEYEADAEYDRDLICNFGDFRFSMINYEEFGKCLYDRKMNKIVASNITNYGEYYDSIYLISNQKDKVLKLNTISNTVYEGNLDTFDSKDQDIFTKLKNNESLYNLWEKIFNFKDSDNKETIAYFGDGSIRIQLNKENKYELINAKEDKKLLTINKFYYLNDPLYTIFNKYMSEFPILYCVGDDGYIAVYFTAHKIYISQHDDFHNFDSDDQKIFSSDSIEWTTLN